LSYLFLKKVEKNAAISTKN